MAEPELPNPAILLGCLLAGRGLPVDWRAVAEAAVLLEQSVDPATIKPPPSAPHG